MAKKDILWVIAAVVLILTLVAVMPFKPYEADDYSYNLSSCKGTAECFTGNIEEIYDGDTLRINGRNVRLALVDSPEKGKEGYEEAADFAENICPIDSLVLVDEDDWQTDGSYGRMVAVVHCREKILNKELLEAGHAKLLTEFCEASEFGKEEWAVNSGC